MGRGSLDGVEGDHRWIRVLPPVLLCAGLWGSAFPAIKTVYGLWEEAGIDAGPIEFWWFAGVRFVLAGTLLLIVAKRPVREFRATPKLRLLGFSLTQTFGQYLFFYLAIAVASGSLTGLLTATGSFWWMVLAPLMAGAPRPSGMQWVAIAIGGVGVTLATAAPGAGAGQPVLGATLMVLATGLGAVGLIQFGRMRETIGARAATGYSLLGGGLLLLIAGAPAFVEAGRLMTPGVMLLTLWLAVVSASAFGLWNHLSTKHPVPLLAGYRFLIPLAGMTESLLLLEGESAGWGLLAGAALVVGSLVMAQRVR
ncbi:drug/metabolite transporter (DMT) superfamily protein [Haloferula helveola]|uniref:Drug/metabolite transporter (DMT) superfamily protein n=1 Tax=Haloferula helveola TaxID=490095 RepID=A0ABN6H7A4_9BACT|nr:drug/metabolite transporter (DMT) superfamily protein [Haloferula helveola]